VGCDVVQTPGQTGQQDVQIAGHKRDTPNVHLRAIGKAAQEPARAPYLLSQGYEMAMEGLGEHCSQLIQAVGDNIASISLAATHKEEVCFDGNIGWADRFHNCSFSKCVS
jgi:hypothetical protein